MDVINSYCVLVGLDSYEYWLFNSPAIGVPPCAVDIQWCAGQDNRTSVLPSLLRKWPGRFFHVLGPRLRSFSRILPPFLVSIQCPHRSSECFEAVLMSAVLGKFWRCNSTKDNHQITLERGFEDAVCLLMEGRMLQESR